MQPLAQQAPRATTHNRSTNNNAFCAIRGRSSKICDRALAEKSKTHSSILRCKRFPEACPTLYLLGVKFMRISIIGLGRGCYNFLYFVSWFDVTHTSVSTENTKHASGFCISLRRQFHGFAARLAPLFCVDPTQANGKNCIECVRINTKTCRCITLSVCTLHTFFSFSNMTWGETESSASTMTVFSWTLVSIDLTPTKNEKHSVS